MKNGSVCFGSIQKDSHIVKIKSQIVKNVLDKWTVRCKNSLTKAIAGYPNRMKFWR